MMLRVKKRILLSGVMSFLIFAILLFSLQTVLTVRGNENQNISYAAADVFSKMLENETVPKDSVWTYSAKRLILEGNEYKLSGSWITPTLEYGKSGTDSIDAILPKHLLIDNTCNGVSAKDNVVYTYTGSDSGYMGAVTFVAPLSGEIKLSDLEKIGIGSAGTGSPFTTLNKSGTKIGIAIYKNNEKIWPSNNDYHVLNGEKWVGGNKVYGNIVVDFPDLGVLRVTRGDKIRIACMPLKLSSGYIKMSPKVDYISVDDNQPELVELPVYSSAEEVYKLCENGSVDEDTVWTYTPKRVTEDKTDGLYKQTGDWLYPELEYGLSDNLGVNSLLPKQMNIPAKRSGIASDGNKVYTFAGYGEGYSSTLTFVAPLSGKIKLTDPNNIGIGSAGTADPFWTLHEPKKLGVVIYINDEKVWPANDDYHQLKGNDWSTNPPTMGNLSTDLPDLGILDVTQGDEIHFSVIPLDLAWGYVALAPTVEYIDVDKEQPDKVTEYKFKASSEIENVLSNGEFKDSNWTLETKACYPNENGENEMDEKWISPQLNPNRTSSEEIFNVQPNWMMLEGSQVGITTYNKAVILSTGSAGVDLAVSLTFTAPKSGKINLTDPAGGMFGSASLAAPFWSLNETTKIAGLAIYKNDEKLWPTDKDYYKLQGQWDGSIGDFDYENEYEIPFPSIKNIEVQAGDKLRVCVIPVKNTWQYITLSPEVKYQEIDLESSIPENNGDTAKPLASYRAVDAVKNALALQKFEDSVWHFNAVTFKESMIVDEPNELSVLHADELPFIYKHMNFNATDFGVDCFNVPLTDLSISVDENDRLLLRPQCGNYYSAVVFKAPKTGVIRLHANDANPGFAAYHQYFPYYTLQTPFDPDDCRKIQLYIYKNSTQIWPTSADENNTLTNEKRVIPFPDLDLQVYEGDEMRFLLTSDNSWQFCNFDPVIDYVSYNDYERPANDEPGWNIGVKAGEIVWEDFDTETVEADSNEYFDNIDNIDVVDNSIETESDNPTKKVKKSIVKHKYFKKNNTGIIIGIIIGSVVVSGVAVAVFFFIKKKKRIKG